MQTESNQLHSFHYPEMHLRGEAYQLKDQGHEEAAADMAAAADALKQLQTAPLADAALAELEALYKEAGGFLFADGKWVCANGSDDPQLVAQCYSNSVHSRKRAKLICTGLNALPGLLARLRAAEAVRPWISTEAMPVLPEDCPQEYWVAFADGSVGQLWWAYRATMDENWDEDEPYTGWMFEDMSDGLNVYNGPQPLFYKEMEAAPAAPTMEGGQPRA
jgi:hypothetical protein